MCKFVYNCAPMVPSCTPEGPLTLPCNYDTAQVQTWMNANVTCTLNGVPQTNPMWEVTEVTGSSTATATCTKTYIATHDFDDGCGAFAGCGDRVFLCALCFSSPAAL